jgi:hypothetical protein
MFASDLERCGGTNHAATFACKGLAVARFWKETTLPDVDQLRLAFERAREGSERVAFMVIIDADAAAPSREIRSALGEVLASLGDQLDAWAGSVEGGGLDASSKRTMMRLIMSLGRVRCPWVVVSSPREAAQWLSDSLAATRGPGDVEHWIQLIGAARTD